MSSNAIESSRMCYIAPECLGMSSKLIYISKNMNSSIVSSDMQSLHASTALNRSAHNAQSV